MQLLIKGGRVIDPAQGVDEYLDVYIENEKITQLGKDINIPGAQVLAASGLIVASGLVDMHVHLREPPPVRTHPAPARRPAPVVCPV